MKPLIVGNTQLVAGGAEAVPTILELLESQGVRTEANPDIYVREYKTFGVDDAIELRDRSNRRPIAGARRFFIIATPGMTTEAQNALLKTLEEPSADAAFFIIVPAPELLLPTLRSRAQILSLDTEGQKHVIDAKTFLAATPHKRLEMLAPLLEKDDDDPEKPRGHGAGKRDIGSILTFLSSLERRIANTAPGNGKRDALSAVYRARKYMSDKGALVKPLLEQVALLVPKL